MSDKEKFKEYCAHVMGYGVAYIEPPNILEVWIDSHATKYNPYDDLNQSMPVADKLMADKGLHITLVDEEPIQKQINDFIIFTMKDKDNG